VGLGGELRGVSGIRERVREAERIGFGRVLLPFRDADSIKSGTIIRIGAGNLAEALEAAWE
jgi:DNA repair protein RadA/Sms